MAYRLSSSGGRILLLPLNVMVKEEEREGVVVAVVGPE